MICIGKTKCTSEKGLLLYACSPGCSPSARTLFSLSFPLITHHVLYGVGPPPQYTPEDLSPEDPMLQHPGDLDLDDPSSLPLTERPPDLPPPMAMLPSNRPLPSDYRDDPGKLLFSHSLVLPRSI